MPLIRTRRGEILIRIYSLGWYALPYFLASHLLMRANSQGTLLEKFMTMTPEEFTTFTRSEAATEAKDSSLREAYRYAKVRRTVYLCSLIPTIRSRNAS